MEIMQFAAYGLINGALYGMVALGLSLAYGIMGYLNVAQGHVIVLGAYGTYWLFRIWEVDPFVSIPILMGGLFILGAVLYVAVYSWLLKFPVIDRLKSSLLISFGLMLVFENLAILLWTADERAVTTSYSGRVMDLSGVRLPYIGLGTIVLAVIVVIALHLFLNKTYFGKAIRATAQDWEASQLMGINVARTYLLSFALSILIAAPAGAVISMRVISPGIGVEWSNYGLVLVILAGVGNINAILPAGFFLGLIEAMSVYLVGAPYTGMAGLVVFLLVLLFRPQGLFRGRAGL
ncbi:MAG: branched-chain amino acid ABC transporter permease [Deltaproteobacteria bacterium]|nr:branched-chain amino acid ABC transporter permease [Deltaproteobacteria bacterium]